MEEAPEETAGVEQELDVEAAPGFDDGAPADPAAAGHEEPAAAGESTPEQTAPQLDADEAVADEEEKES